MESNKNRKLERPSSRWSLRGKNFVVTGGTKGIGKAVIKDLLDHDAAGILFCSLSPCNFTEYLTSMNLDPDLSYTKGNADDGVPIIQHVICDVSSSEGREVLIRTAKETFGGEDNDSNDVLPCVHGLINNVGINVRKTILEQTPEEYHDMVRTNVDAAYFLCRMFSNLFVEGNSTIVNVSSAAGVQSSGTGAAYGMTKAAINHFTRILACEWANRKIRVNAVTPWMTVSQINKKKLHSSKVELLICTKLRSNFSSFYFNMAFLCGCWNYAFFLRCDLYFMDDMKKCKIIVSWYQTFTF
jgi:Tropinone reductase 1